MGLTVTGDSCVDALNTLLYQGLLLRRTTLIFEVWSERTTWDTYLKAHSPQKWHLDSMPRCFLIIYVHYFVKCKSLYKPPLQDVFFYFFFFFTLIFWCSILGEGFVIIPSTIHLPHFFFFFCLFQFIYVYRKTKHLISRCPAVMTISLSAVNMVKFKPQTKPSWGGSVGVFFSFAWGLAGMYDSHRLSYQVFQVVAMFISANKKKKKKWHISLLALYNTHTHTYCKDFYFLWKYVKITQCNII